MPGVRPLRAATCGLVFVFASFAGLVGGGITLLAATVGVCAAAGVALYGVADLFAYLFGIPFRWGLVGVCGLVLVGLPAGALVHDLRMLRRLTVPQPSPTDEP